MRITSFGHACVLLESGSTRLLVDPGTYARGFETLTGLHAIAATHQHPDHLDPDRLSALRAANPEAQLLLEIETVAAFEIDDPEPVVVSPGFSTRLGDLSVRAVGGRHAANHDRVPPLANVGFLVQTDGVDGATVATGATVFHPGDSYDEAPAGVDVLGLPLNAPWCRMRETLAFLHEVSPRVVIPIHTGLLSDDGLSAYLMHVQRFGPDGTEVVDLRPAASYDV
jgi:L-ascorbate metabolism protein UlaG (beta-lactamase superfamily)